MSTIEPADEMVEAATRRWADSNPAVLSFDEMTEMMRTAVRAFLAVSSPSAPPEDDREALQEAIREAWRLQGPGNSRIDMSRIAAEVAFARRSPVSPPEDVTALLEEANAWRNENPEDPRTEIVSERVTNLIGRLADALAALWEPTDRSEDPR